VPNLKGDSTIVSVFAGELGGGMFAVWADKTAVFRAASATNNRAIGEFFMGSGF
jgi:hypothetical protein